MIRPVSALVLFPALVFAQATPASVHEAFSARQAYAYTAQVAAFGVRWPGSAGHAKTEDLIRRTVQRDGGVLDTDEFTATTPRGPVPVHNIIAKFNVSANPAQPIFILAGHYDTLFKPGFIGANDGASSTAILLAFADALSGGLKARPLKMQIWLVWTDLEEAIQSFQGDDGLYGSRHLAHKLQTAGIAGRVKGFFLLDMIGDKDLGVTRETRSTAWLQDFIAQAARTLGYGQYFFQDSIEIIDDHVSFLDVGIPSVDVVDARYGRMLPNGDGMGEFHHSNADTMDKVSQASLEIVGRTVLLAVELIDARM